MAPAQAVPRSTSPDPSQELRMALQEQCALAGWPPQHLGRPGQEPGLEEALEEIIACRAAEATLLSLELIACCERLGWHSPWLDDNRARILVQDGDEPQAIAIWERLSQNHDPAVRAIATDTLAALARRPALTVRLDRIRKLRERNQPELWRPLLLEAWLNHAGNTELQQLLREIARELAGQTDHAWDEALLEQEFCLRLYEEQMERWERC